MTDEEYIKKLQERIERLCKVNMENYDYIQKLERKLKQYEKPPEVKQPSIFELEED